MVLRCCCLIVVVLVGLSDAAPAKAQFVRKLVHSIAIDTKRNNCWPKPFSCPARQAVRAPLVVMVNNGWECQNLLGDHHFQPGTEDLTEAGQHKVRWIIDEVPTHHRAIFVRRAESPEETAARVDAVQKLAIRLIPEGELPPVFVSNLSAGGWPATQVDAIGRKFEASIPDPRLPDAATGTGISN